MQNVKVFNIFNRPKVSKEKVNPNIYEYDYIDKKTGEKKHNKINQQEKIQSNLAKVDYKKQIERGELILDGISTSEGTRDFTVIPGDKVDFIDFIAKVSRMDSKQIDTLVESVFKNTQEQTKENSNQDGEITPTAGENKSNGSGDSSKVNEGGQE